MAPKFAFIGLGGMGQAITRRLVNEASLDAPMLLWNRTASRAQEHSATIGHSKVVATLQEAVTPADIIWSCLENGEAVKEVFDELLQYDVAGKLIVESSSIPSSVTNELAERAQSAGADFLAMPVFGDPGVAAQGKLICVPCGTATVIERMRPYLEGVIAKAVVELPDTRAGNASTLKLIGNVLILLSMETIAEALVLSEKAGLGTAPMAKLIASLFPLPPHSIYREKMETGEYHSGKPAVNLRMAQGLAAHVVELADGTGASIPAYKAAVAHLADAEEHGGSYDRDITSLYGAVRVESGLPFAPEKS